MKKQTKIYLNEMDLLAIRDVAHILREIDRAKGSNSFWTVNDIDDLGKVENYIDGEFYPGQLENQNQRSLRAILILSEKDGE